MPLDCWKTETKGGGSSTKLGSSLRRQQGGAVFYGAGAVTMGKCPVSGCSEDGMS